MKKFAYKGGMVQYTSELVRSSLVQNSELLLHVLTAVKGKYMYGSFPFFNRHVFLIPHPLYIAAHVFSIRANTRK